MDFTSLQFCAFDLETTGINVNEDRIVTANITHIDPTTGHVDSTNWLANPGIDISPQATEVHGISNEHARQHGRPHDDVVQEVATNLTTAWNDGKAIIVYNAPFDLSMMTALTQQQFQVGGLVIDPLTLDRALSFRRGSRKLVDVAKHYELPVDEGNAHAADYDALLAARIAWRVLRRFKRQLPSTIEDLMLYQSNAYRRQHESLKKYMESKGTQISGDAGWPVQHSVTTGN